MASEQRKDVRADILLVTVTPIERDAVLSIFAKETGRLLENHADKNVPYFDLGVITDRHVMMVQSEMGVSGPGGSHDVTAEGIRILGPSAVIMVGIAFGVDEVKQKIGDILVSKQLFNYEPQKIATDKEGRKITIPRGDRPQASAFLLSLFRHATADWHDPTVDFGLLLSGDKLVDNLIFREQLRVFAPEALGGEMEGVGLYTAAYQSKVDWIIVKAICDFADGKKGQNKAANQRLAAENASRFTLHVLKKRGFNEGSSPLPTLATTEVKGATPYQYTSHAGWVLAVAWSPDGSRIASGGADGTVRIWKADTRDSILTYQDHPRLLNKISLQSKVYTLAWSPDSSRVVSAGTGKNVNVWDAINGQTLTLYKGHSIPWPEVFAVAWSPHGTQIASACSGTGVGIDKTIHVWDTNTGRTLKTYATHYNDMLVFYIYSLAWSPDGKYLAASCGDKAIRIWDTNSEKLISIFPFNSQSSSYIAWSPNSQYLASAHSDHTIQIWDVPKDEQVKTYFGHTDSVRCVIWSPDARYLASASNDTTVRLWNASTGKHFYTYQGHTNWVTSVSWSPDGTHIASASNDRTVHVWPMEYGE